MLGMYGMIVGIFCISTFVDRTFFFGIILSNHMIVSTSDWDDLEQFGMNFLYAAERRWTNRGFRGDE